MNPSVPRSMLSAPASPPPTSSVPAAPYLVGSGPARTYVNLTDSIADKSYVGFPKRPTVGSAADLDLIHDHCDFSKGLVNP